MCKEEDALITMKDLEAFLLLDEEPRWFILQETGQPCGGLQEEETKSGEELAIYRNPSRLRERDRIRLRLHQGDKHKF